MKYHTQFLTRNRLGYISESLGSDGVFILDGRCGRDTMIQDSRNQLRRMRKIHPQYIGFVIKKGERLDQARIVYREESNE